MSKPDYKCIGLPEDKVIEECAELIHIICKAKRFGYTSYHPDDPKRIPNYYLIYDEMEDVLDVIKEYEKWLITKVKELKLNSSTLPAPPEGEKG